MYYYITLKRKFISFNLKYFTKAYKSVLYLDLDHVEFTIQILKLQDLPDEEVSITMSHLRVCDMNHFMVNVEIQLQQVTYEVSKCMYNI
jgi:hypothetical protein